MNKKVWLLIALAIAFLSVSVVSAYVSIVSSSPTYEDFLPEDCGDYVVVAENSTIKGNVKITDMLIYSERFGYISIHKVVNMETGRGFLEAVGGSLGVFYAEIKEEASPITPTTVTSAVSGVLSACCFGTVAVKKRQKAW